VLLSIVYHKLEKREKQKQKRKRRKKKQKKEKNQLEVLKLVDRRSTPPSILSTSF